MIRTGGLLRPNRKAPVRFAARPPQRGFGAFYSLAGNRRCVTRLAYCLADPLFATHPKHPAV